VADNKIERWESDDKEAGNSPRIFRHGRGLNFNHNQASGPVRGRSTKGCPEERDGAGANAVRLRAGRLRRDACGEGLSAAVTSNL